MGQYYSCYTAKNCDENTNMAGPGKQDAGTEVEGECRDRKGKSIKYDVKKDGVMKCINLLLDEPAQEVSAAEDSYIDTAELDAELEAESEALAIAESDDILAVEGLCA
eukprot:tig00001604_g9413.t1